MTINVALGPVMALTAGVMILLVPRLLNYIVASYLIVIGLIGIFGWGGTHIHSTAADTAPLPAATVIAAALAFWESRTRAFPVGARNKTPCSPSFVDF